MAKKDSLNFNWVPKTNGQKLAKEMWRRSRILFLIGDSGTGKTSTALGLALTDVLRSDTMKLKLTRSQVHIDNVKQGFLPGDLPSKLLPYLMPFYDVFEDMSSGTVDNLIKHLGDRLELFSVPMCRGRTVKNGILIVDEAQNLTFDSLKALLTRVGKDGRLIITGDTVQSDLYADPKDSPLAHIADKLQDIDTVGVVKFGPSDQMRSELVTQILERI